jgi:hypothetical protein
MGTGTLNISIGTEHLKAAIHLLRAWRPEVTHPEAWRILTTEADRRRAGAPITQVDMARSVFDALPMTVQDLLTGERPHG